VALRKLREISSNIPQLFWFAGPHIMFPVLFYYLINQPIIIAVLPSTSSLSELVGFGSIAFAPPSKA
jgi:hypothetical protein